MLAVDHRDHVAGEPVAGASATFCARRTDFCTPPKDIPIAAAIALNGTPDARILATSASPAVANAADRDYGIHPTSAVSGHTRAF